MVNFIPLTAEIGSLVWGTPANFNRFRVLASLLRRRRSPQTNQTLHDVCPTPVHYTYIFRGSCLMTEFCRVQNSLCVHVLRSPILAALLHGTPAAGVSQTLWLGTRNGITELSQMAPPIFGWVAITLITLSIGPHSSFVFCAFFGILCVLVFWDYDYFMLWVPVQLIAWEARPRNDLSCIERDVKQLRSP